MGSLEAMAPRAMLAACRRRGLRMPQQANFAALLKQFRVAAGLTHESLAERAGLGARTISDLERGVSKAPRPDTLTLLIEALPLSPEQRELLETSARQQSLAGQ